MINEVLYMETRIFRQFCSAFHYPASKANKLFNTYNIWQYIESCYPLFHTCGDDYILDDIAGVLKQKGVAL